MTSSQIRPYLTAQFLSSLLLLLQLPTAIHARNSNSNSAIDYSIYGMSMQRDWLYDSNHVSMKYLGCVWGYVDADNGENLGCMPNESEDGTTSWYQMANCRRAQVAYGMYASSGSTNCKNKDFQESFVSQNGVAEFMYNLGSYSSSSPAASDYTDQFPACEGDGSGYYLATGCSSKGEFIIARFTDQYCLEYDSTYDYLNDFNSAMKQLSCFDTYNSNYDSDVSYSAAMISIADSGSCSASESSLCTTSSFVSGSGSGGGFQHSRSFGSVSSLSFSNKVKYTLGGTMLLGSVVMFVGILFTNRRKRHAMMHRKFRQSTDKKKKKKKGSSSARKSSKSRERRSNNNNGVFA